MDLDLDDAAREWREEVRTFIRETATDELYREMHGGHGEEYPGPAIIKFQRELGARGWNTLTWPKEFGGRALSEVYTYIMQIELMYWGLPRPGLSVTSIAPMIMRYGTPQNQKEFLPGIASGEITVAVGYSEPNSGSDLASLRTRAELDGDEWIINGQKIWNSFANCASHEWLCVKTDPDAARHRGLSVIFVPIDSPGIEVRPLFTWGDGQTNETFFTDVRVPRTNLIGEVNQGWSYMTGALDHERFHFSFGTGSARRAVDELLSLARTMPRQGDPFQELCLKRKLAQFDAEVEALLLLGLETATKFDAGEIPTRAVTTIKIALTELQQRIADVGTQMNGGLGILASDDPLAPLHGRAEGHYRNAPVGRFGGGANELMRDIIAQRGYGMPSYGR